ncbi:right-handed parallel beta-helix repeat-containing protein [Halegenticoccus tardaugens]|uniref:right-handed parallel beta-helix repeat-containing protein n=1 Tax=Halegenticoccus tardaugens TaxID=2071624 RepID=UPI00100BA3C2|nr:right-handed parallel beta-helix repeat-containing protein [Halegenticoccus tardaugens]
MKRTSAILLSALVLVSVIATGVLGAQTGLFSLSGSGDSDGEAPTSDASSGAATADTGEGTAATEPATSGEANGTAGSEARTDSEASETPDSEASATPPPGDGHVEPTAVGTCTVIDEPGRYVLARNLTNASAGSCLTITADEVHVDGGGHEVDAAFDERADDPSDPREGVGVAVGGDESVENVTVSNLTATDWETGVAYENASGGELRNVEVRSSATGVAFSDTDDSRIKAVAVADAREGDAVVLRSSDGNRLVDNTVSDNDFTSIAGNAGGVALSASSDNVIRNNTLAESNAGVRLDESSDDNEIVGNDLRIVEMGGVAIRADGSGGTEIRENEIKRAADVQGITGVELSGATDTTVRNNAFVAVDVRIADASENVEVRGNLLTDGVLDVGGGSVDVSVIGNRLVDGRIRVDAGAENVTVRDNELVGGDVSREDGGSE